MKLVSTLCKVKSSSFCPFDEFSSFLFHNIPAPKNATRLFPKTTEQTVDPANPRTILHEGRCGSISTHLVGNSQRLVGRRGTLVVFETSGFRWGNSRRLRWCMVLFEGCFFVFPKSVDPQKNKINSAFQNFLRTFNQY